MTQRPSRIRSQQSTEIRRQIAYYTSLGYLAYIDDDEKRECSSVDELREQLGIKNPARFLRTLVKDEKVEECPEHEGRYRITYAYLKKLGLE